ncbi:50S ribosomal protein L25 [Candidatus Falkowbacteria bacterium]|nr:50S ribosomal protein L25 [Candidatus Falkowbacteria bacterium]
MTIKLEAKKREITGKKVYSLRQANKIPAVLYGHGTINQNLELDYIAFEKVYQEAGENTIIDLILDGAVPLKVLIAEVQSDPIKGRFFHIDLQQIRMDEKITTAVELKFVGESKSVKEDGGVLIHNLSEIEIRCLPSDLIHEIEVDISSLEKFNDVIIIKDLKLPKNIEIIGHEAEDVVAMVAAPKVEVEEEKPVEPVVEGEGESQPAEAEKPVQDGQLAKKDKLQQK